MGTFYRNNLKLFRSRIHLSADNRLLILSRLCPWTPRPLTFSHPVVIFSRIIFVILGDNAAGGVSAAAGGGVSAAAGGPLCAS